MTTQSKDNHDNNTQNHSKDDSHKGKQGFASMPHDKVQEIAKKGGETTHKGEGNHKEDDKK